MRRTKAGNGIIVIVLIVVVGWPLYQLYDMMNAKSERHDAARLLYQVSLFQMELLNSIMNEAERATSTMQLNGLKQAIYSANFTHERLVMAVGKENLASLQSVPQLMQFILGLQIGGERPLRPAELETIKQISGKFKELYGAYELLMDSKGQIIFSQNEKITMVDAQIRDYVEEKRFE